SGADGVPFGGAIRGKDAAARQATELDLRVRRQPVLHLLDDLLWIERAIDTHDSGDRVGVVRAEVVQLATGGPDRPVQRVVDVRLRFVQGARRVLDLALDVLGG